VVEKGITPNGKFVATVELINGGATTSFSSEIWIECAPGKGALYRERAGTWEQGCKNCLSVSWIDDDHLRVTYLSRAEKPLPKISNKIFLGDKAIFITASPR